ncbi:MAG: polysaccharide biosynthesis/export family protein [Bacteroidota bacterium]
MKLNYGSWLLGLVLLSSGCVSYESLLNYNQQPAIPTEPQLIANYIPITIQTNDILHIQVSSAEVMANEPFELAGQTGNANNTQNLLMNGYLVDLEGRVDFPTLGQVAIGGLTIQEAREHLLQLLEPYFEQAPIVNIRLLNFRVSVNGEVNNPGTFNVLNERLTIVEALTMAGDFTDYSMRDSILIVRESAGERSFGYVDFNSAEIFTSPYFYLQQNDVVYIRPDKRKVGIVRDPATRFFTWISAITGVAAFIITVTR